jgi:hypothetical protein
MSRLDSFIRRLEAQRACLDHAAALIADLPGPVLEVGLGNGRTFDHLRSLLPGRDIYVFDRQIAAHPDCVPPERFRLLGDFRETLPRAAAVVGRPAALIHADLGTGDEMASQALARDIAPLLSALLSAGGVLAGDQAMADQGLEALPLPAGVATGRYHLYRRRP